MLQLRNNLMTVQRMALPASARGNSDDRRGSAIS
jgi:hypothetical protein